MTIRPFEKINYLRGSRVGLRWRVGDNLTFVGTGVQANVCRTERGAKFPFASRFEIPAVTLGVDNGCDGEMNERPGDNSIPYFERIFRGLENNNPDVADAFGNHVHWGYWKDPEDAQLTTEEFKEASERMCVLVCDAAGIRDDMQVLDVGCGFGGTLASLNQRFSRLELVGVNFDARQLARAAQAVKANGQNTIEFVESDAAAIPLSDHRFDVVLAVESAFHFDRQGFFAESKRLLKQRGRLTVSDFVISEKAAAYLDGLSLFSNDVIRQSYGQVDLSYTLRCYESLAAEYGFTLSESIDITDNTMPTYDYLRSDAHQTSGDEGKAFLESTEMLQKACAKGLMHYLILNFDR